MTSDLKAGEAFYCSVVGWTAERSEAADGEYHVFSAGSEGIGGIMPLTAGAPPCWSGYIGVDDVDAYVEKVVAAGGSICHPATDIPNVGRFSVAADPQGGRFILFRPTGPGERKAVPPNTVGHIGWHELVAVDPETVFPFYGKLFGWTKAEAMDMGELGLYQMFATDKAPVGGMMKMPPGCPGPYWLYYINIEGINAAVARVRNGGGQVVHGPQQVPGGSWIAQCIDPQGAHFGLVAGSE